ncbi:GTP-binding protein [Alteribacter lacisalsi]|uniref:GTP-binding protein n=1 Tax=Alteribacter lacisalsi TaxID=2045244 RepID=A0A2W0HC27_9BACI|nr:nucleoside recognition domain-containing protein [Alteribacter lacisalsi]PYZ97550.1 GTP-binding protein [Alteribacter lacisalsi]
MNGSAASAPSVLPVPPFFKKTVFLLLIVLIYGGPVYAAYHFALWVEPLAERFVILPAAALAEGAPNLVYLFLFGDFGIVSLGTFSLVWAFPVVVFVGISIAVTEASGLQRELIRTVDPMLRRIGLTGSDLVPVLTGYGCNVVAIMKAQSCRSCRQTSCAAMIFFGSACSYQIGATLSVFNAAQVPWLFLPYILMLFIVGAVHTRVWHGKPAASAYPLRSSLNATIRIPDPKRVKRKVTGMIRQFFLQAMPVFLLICIIAFVLSELKIIAFAGRLAEPIFQFLSLSTEALTGILFSFLRKDGILLFNEGGGALIMSFTTVEVFIFVYLASTLSGCLVTVWTIGKYQGAGQAIRLTLQQALSAIVSALAILSIARILL